MTTPPIEHIADIAAAIGSADSVCVITGAGVSAESGLRTFRGVTGMTAEDHGSMASLWKDFDPATLATAEAFAADPERVTRWYDWRRLGCLAAEPNAAHLGLAEIERRVAARGAEFTLLTQNVDRLHQRAGSRNVVELHGTIMAWRCLRTGKEVEPEPRPFDRFPPRSPLVDDSSDPLGVLRPSVVWFGEMLPPDAVARAEAAAASCDLFLSVGTSSVVYPAAGFIQRARERGADTAEINLEPTPISRLVRWSVRAKAGAALGAVAAALGSRPGP